MAIRGVEARLKFYKDNPPGEAGWCAREVMEALNAPRQNLPNATAVANVVLKAGHMRSGRAPRGAIAYWVGGAVGDGHTCFTLGDGNELSVDVNGAGRVGVVPFSWFAKHWPSLRYVGWSWWWGSINTEPVTVVAEDVKPIEVTNYRNIKVETDQVIALNEWVDLDLGPVDIVLPPVGSDDWWFQIHLDLGALTGAARNDLRYIKGRWARLNPTSTDANKQGLDTHGTDTKAISLDLPRSSWQSSFSTDMKGLAGVPVKAQVFIGSLVDGTVVSPMRLFTVDDETT